MTAFRDERTWGHCESNLPVKVQGFISVLNYKVVTASTIALPPLIYGNSFILSLIIADD